VIKPTGLTVTMPYNAQGHRVNYPATGAGNNLSGTCHCQGGDLAQLTSTGTQNRTDTGLYQPLLERTG
jgi:hypothetical protein